MSDATPSARSALDTLIYEYGEHSPTSVHTITDVLLSDHADTVDGWLAEHVRTLLAAYVQKRLSSIRSRERRRAMYEDIATAMADPDSPAVSVFSLSHVVDDQHTRKTLGTMTKADVMFVADSYEADAQRASLYADVYRQIAQKVPASKTVADVFTEEQLRSLFSRLTVEVPA